MSFITNKIQLVAHACTECKNSENIELIGKHVESMLILIPQYFKLMN